MPDDPNRNLEEQLNAWARQRRAKAGAPFELHPATRKLLQDEVARTFPKKSDAQAAPSGGWKILWPRFALAGTISVALFAVAGLLLPGLTGSKSKTQQLASVRHQEQDLSADSEKRDAPVQVAPARSASRAVQAPALQAPSEPGRTSVAETQPPAAPPVAQNTPFEQQVKAQTEVKDARFKAEQPASIEERPLSEKSKQTVLSDKAKESAATPAGAAAAPSVLKLENERTPILSRQRSGPAPEQAGVTATSGLAEAQKLRETPAPPSAAPPQVALKSAAAIQPAGGAGGRGLGGGPASNATAAANLAFKRTQNAPPADDLGRAFGQSNRVATANVDSLAARTEAERLGTASVYNYYAATPALPASQRFARVREYRVNFNSPPMPDVLNSFQLVRNGRQIRVVDADGSIYDGGIELPPTQGTPGRAFQVQRSADELKKTLEPEPRRPSAGVTAGKIAPEQNVFFRVAGTNRTLKQWVVFDGNFLANSNPTNASVVGAKLSADQSSAAARQNLGQRGQQVSGAMIQGRATIGPNYRIEINAAPVPE